MNVFLLHRQDRQTDEETFKDYTEELQSWAWTMEISEWVLTIHYAARAAACAVKTVTKTAAQRKRNQMTVRAHLFKSFKNSLKGRPGLDTVSNIIVFAFISTSSVNL